MPTTSAIWEATAPTRELPRVPPPHTSAPHAAPRRRRARALAGGGSPWRQARPYSGAQGGWKIDRHGLCCRCCLGHAMPAAATTAARPRQWQRSGKVNTPTNGPALVVVVALLGLWPRFPQVRGLRHATEVHEDPEVDSVTLVEAIPLVPVQEHILVGEFFPELLAFDEAVAMQMVLDEETDVAFPSLVRHPRNGLRVRRPVCRVVDVGARHAGGTARADRVVVGGGGDGTGFDHRHRPGVLLLLLLALQLLHLLLLLLLLCRHHHCLHRVAPGCAR
mmetsp:Transcript_49497/g.141900  ORF Transcript_49497/g.141900 Transcript_49497/m.141900 type:complete len:277 (+) Transcript_49497:41-871(+)